ncbi:hypothetical protein [Brachyspira pulli]|uniref:hypothetical protein n=1 Tax=Brachyspira pulli TaxID=310721 RepID=UPI00300550B9
MEKNNEKKITEDFKEILSSIKIKTGEAVNDIVDRVKINLKDKIDNINSDDLIIFFKRAWNLEELEMDILTLEKCIYFVKKEFNPKLYSSACILDSKNVNRNSKYRFEIHICFLDRNDNAILNGNAKHWIIHTNTLDKDLLNQFGNKDMIILK